MKRFTLAICACLLLVATAVVTYPIRSAEDCPADATTNMGGEFPQETKFRRSVDEGFFMMGIVLDADCKAVYGAKVIYWVAAPNGKYDPEHEGYVLTNKHGVFWFESNFPGTYEGAPPHIHFAVTADKYKPVVSVYAPTKGDESGWVDVMMPAQDPATATP
jgi:protocatechuate 3,4-dioxygenase beta subunit